MYHIPKDTGAPPPTTDTATFSTLPKNKLNANINAKKSQTSIVSVVKKRKDVEDDEKSSDKKSDDNKSKPKTPESNNKKQKPEEENPLASLVAYDSDSD